MIYNNIEQLIGNTPLLKISQKSHEFENIDVYVKLEYLNPFGSIKDRTALGLTKNVSFSELNQKGTKLIESSSGNTAKALQLIASRQGSSLVSVTNRVKVPEVDQLLKYIGVDLISLPGLSECPDPDDDDNAITKIEQMQKEDPGAYYHTEQYSNHANPEAHSLSTAQEMFDDLGSIDYIITGVGTGGSSGGLIEYVDEHGLETKSIGVVSEPSDFLPGIRTRTELFETSLFKKDWFEALVDVSSRDALAALDLLVRNEGILAGPTTGANFAAVKSYLKDRDTLRTDGSRKVVVFLACDRLESYMSYIAKRLPERFKLTGMTDVFDLRVTDEQKREYSKPANTETKQWIHEQGVRVIDMRSAKAYGAFHIEGALGYPEAQLRDACEQGSPFDSSRPVLIVCPRGDRSSAYATILRKRGIESYSLEGGLLAWRAAKLPLYRREFCG